MKISKARLKEIIREELENLEEYSPYQKGARPDKRHKKPGEIKDDGKHADPKRARPQKRYEEQEEPIKEDEQIQLRKELEAMGLGSFRHDPSKQDTDRVIKNINKKLSFNPDPETTKKLKDLKFRVANLNDDDYKSERWYDRARQDYYSTRKREPSPLDYMLDPINEELTRQDKTDVKKMVQD